MNYKRTSRRARELPHITTVIPARLVLLQNLLDAEDEPSAGLLIGHDRAVFRCIPAALARREIEGAP